MTTYFQFIRAHLLDQVPMVERAPLEEVRIYQSQILEFEIHCHRRLAFGYYRYHHDFREDRAGTHRVVDDAIRRLKEYKRTGNLELLFDVANFCAIEYKFPTHPNPTFESIDDGEHVPHDY
jgi:hypothetical protein